MKIYIVGNANNYLNWIDNAELVDSPKDADMMLFTGGEDVTPAMYDEKRGMFTHSNYDRDYTEIIEFETNPDKFKLGVCRGAQFLTVMSGGKLIQHVNNHALWGTHSIDTGKETHYITSTHHQMMYPYTLAEEEYELIAWSKDKRGTFYMNGDNKNLDIPKDFKEPEIVWYPKTRSLCIQGHPEKMREGKLHEYLNKLLLEKHNG